VIGLYGCQLLKDSDDVYREENLPEELKIKTHYESLDIADSNRIHYLCFSLPANLEDKETDARLKEKLREHEGVD
jgi:tRNA (guanine-N7-)-methyltransferase